jgi:hypothetical protein
MSNTETVVQPYKRLPLTPDGKYISKKKVILKSPRSQVIISFPKSGKTDSMIDRAKFYIGDAEDGTDKFEGDNVSDLTHYEKGEAPFFVTKSKVYIPAGLYETCMELQRANRMKEFNELYQQFKEKRNEALYEKVVAFINRMPYPIFVVDTLTHMMDLIKSAALAEYNANLSDPDKMKSKINRVDNYGGAQYVRDKVAEMKLFIETVAAPFIVYNGHVKLKKSVLVKSDENIGSVDLALEGQLPLIFTSSAEAVAVFYRNNEGCFLDYTKKSEDDLDARPRHLNNRVIKISDLHKYEIDKNGDQILVEKGKTYWQRIYPELQF